VETPVTAGCTCRKKISLKTICIIDEENTFLNQLVWGKRKRTKEEVAKEKLKIKKIRMSANDT